MSFCLSFPICGTDVNTPRCKAKVEISSSERVRIHTPRSCRDKLNPEHIRPCVQPAVLLWDQTSRSLRIYKFFIPEVGWNFIYSYADENHSDSGFWTRTCHPKNNSTLCPAGAQPCPWGPPGEALGASPTLGTGRGRGYSPVQSTQSTGRSLPTMVSLSRGLKPSQELGHPHRSGLTP